MKLSRFSFSIGCLTYFILVNGTVIAQSTTRTEAPQTQTQNQARGTLLTRSFEEHLKSAQRGHAEAQVLVGMAHQVNYLGTDQNYREAARWFRLAANQGNALGQTFLGKSYLNGLGVEQSITNARKHFTIAAEQGESEAQFMLATILLNPQDDKGTQRLPEDAFKWLSRSAQQGYIPAFAALASLYESGVGVDSDPLAAQDWYKKSCDKGVYASCEQLKKSAQEDATAPLTQHETLAPETRPEEKAFTALTAEAAVSAR